MRVLSAGVRISIIDTSREAGEHIRLKFRQYGDYGSTALPEDVIEAAGAAFTRAATAAFMW